MDQLDGAIDVTVIFRNATIEDLSAIVEMLADDPLGKLREEFTDPLPEVYAEAFSQIDADENHELVVLEIEGAVVGTMQLNFLQYLNRRGGLRMQIESVRIHRDFRGQRLGSKMFEWAIARAKDRGVHLVQLTTDKQRPEALKFYQRLGFVGSHEGMKLHLDQ
jgi:GNAT superfamily N-acetyltransferase